MQRKLIASIGLALITGGASAQSSVTMYGIMDAAVEHVTNCLLYTSDAADE